MTDKLDVTGKKVGKADRAGRSFAVMVVVAAVAIVLARSFLFQPFSIPSGSMRPTLLPGDYLLASKSAYGFSRHSLPFSPNLFTGRIWGSPPERGDVVVFKYPPDTRLDYIKRVVGLPGERIQMRDGQIFINDVAIPRENIGQIEDPDITEMTRPVDVWRETMPNGVSYDTFDVGLSAGDNTREFVVPDGHYFMMGDNRDNSTDSRFNVGFVPAENLVGRASIIYFSIANGVSAFKIWRWPDSIRGSRLLNIVR